RKQTPPPQQEAAPQLLLKAASRADTSFRDPRFFHIITLVREKRNSKFSAATAEKYSLYGG
ncbi:MAG: hypothetical protein J5925_01705, partial [Clostridia bacterium]|nr:hypothetical protein [Clostridia bacterium]